MPGYTTRSLLLTTEKSKKIGLPAQEAVAADLEAKLNRWFYKTMEAVVSFFSAFNAFDSLETNPYVLDVVFIRMAIFCPIMGADIIAVKVNKVITFLAVPFCAVFIGVLFGDIKLPDKPLK